MKIKGIKVERFSEYDGLPIKNKLPEELRERLKTRKQWMEEGYRVKEDAEGYEMHASVPAKKSFMYFLDDDVTKMTPDNMPENCSTCSLRSKGYCIVMADFVGAEGRCSEWNPKLGYRKSFL